MSESAAELNLLYGILALQLEFISRDDLVGAMRTWSRDKSQPLGEILLQQGNLTADQCQLLDSLVHDQTKEHDSARQSLPAMSVSPATKRGLEGVQDTDVKASLESLVARWPTLDVDRTEPTLGAPTSGGARFRVLRPHAKGGLGKVSVALDEELHREVALKEILPQHADNEDHRSRFVREAEITGGLEHPGVVPVYGLGKYPSGRPFYAMRFVRGDNLKEAIDEFHAESDDKRRWVGERGLRLRKLLGRFIDVCNTMEYAHNRAVMHRDLKPANILLGKYGETLIVDWGLAKNLEQEEPSTDLDRQPLRVSSSASSVATQLGAVVGTPAYMSPEQAEGMIELLGPPSDVYSLGATLYHLLAGRPPFEAANIGAVVRNVAKGKFPPPRQVNRTIPRALEAICLNAMQRQPADRYPSAAALAEDIERWLADEPVRAWKAPLPIRIGRWMRRHRSWVSSAAAAGCMALVALSVGIVVLTTAKQSEHQARVEAVNNYQEAQRQQTRAEENLAQAERAFRLARQAVDDYFTEISESTLLNQAGAQPLRRALLQHALDYYRQFIAERGDDPAIRNELAGAFFRVGVITERLGSPAESLPSYRRAREIQEGLLADQPKNLQHLHALGSTVNALGRALQKMQQWDQALQAYEEAAVMREKLVGAAPNVSEYHRTLANSCMNIGQVRIQTGSVIIARRHLQRAQEIRKTELAKRDDPKMRRDLGMGYYNLAILESKEENLADIERNLEEAVDQFEQVLARDPNHLANQHLLATCYRLLGDRTRVTADWKTALEWYESARGQLQWLAYRNPDVPAYQAALASVQLNIGDGQTEQKESAAAADSFQQAFALLNELVAAHPNVPDYRRDFAVTLRSLGTVQIELSERKLARDSLQKSQQLLSKLVAQFPENGDFAEQLARTKTALRDLGDENPGKE